ncbi:MAG: Cof-type HAD-IIB family hydrolase [Christensenellales bacterium]|jgi:Cof subfamily protein (haloacid dehalogenase superfamily)
MTYKLIAFDLDDTALTSDHRITDRLKGAVRRAMDKGVLLVLATGRVPRGALAYVEALGLEGLMINSQGALITDTSSGEILYHTPVPMALVREIVRFMRAHGMYVQAVVPDGFYYELECRYSGEYARLNGFKGTRVDDLERDLPAEPTKMLAIDEPEVILAIRDTVKAHFGGRLEATISKTQLLEMVSPSASKGGALKWLSGRLGIAKEEMIAVGDSFNDLSMIEYAGLGVAVGNAREPVLRAADFVAPTNDEDGLAYTIEKFILGER